MGPAGIHAFRAACIACVFAATLMPVSAAAQSDQVEQDALALAERLRHHESPRRTLTTALRPKVFSPDLERRAFDALAVRSSETLEDVLAATPGRAFPNRDLFEAYAASAGQTDTLPEAITLAKADGDWKRQFTAFVLSTAFHLFHRDNMAGLKAASDAMNVIPHDDMSDHALKARVEVLTYLIPLYVTNRDTEGAVEAAIRLEDAEERAGWHPEHVTVLYNLGMSFTTDGKLEVALELLELASELPGGSAPEHVARINYGIGKLLTQNGEYAKAIPYLERAITTNAQHGDLSGVFPAYAHLRLALAHSSIGNVEATNRALQYFKDIEMSDSVADRAKPIFILIDANLAHARGDADTAISGYRDYISLQELEKNKIVRSERAQAIRAVKTSEAVIDTRTEAAEEIAREAEKRAAMAERQSAIVTGLALLLFFLSVGLLHFFLRSRRYGAAQEALAAEQATLVAEQAALVAQRDELLAKQEILLAQQVIDGERALAGEKAKSEFLAIMSHETRTPLNGILPVLEHIERLNPEPEQKALVRLAIHQSHLVAMMMEKVTTLTAARAGSVFANALPVDVAALAADRVDEFRREYHAHPLCFQLDIRSDRTVFLSDALKLRRALDALLDNACRFTNEGDIRVRMEPCGNSGFALVVTDTGPGMETDDITRLVRPFEQADMSRTRRRDGLGIGLAVTDALAGLLGGTLEVRSQIGSGTQVRLNFPDAEPSELVDFADSRDWDDAGERTVA